MAGSIREGIISSIIGGQSLSTVIDLASYHPKGLSVEVINTHQYTDSDLLLLGSDDSSGIKWVILRDKTGTPIKVTINNADTTLYNANNYVFESEAQASLVYRYLRVVSVISNTETALNQANTINLIIKFSL